jgi:hypothetical protein
MDSIRQPQKVQSFYYMLAVTTPPALIPRRTNG